jgi:hypothetical protein
MGLELTIPEERITGITDTRRVVTAFVTSKGLS